MPKGERQENDQPRGGSKPKGWFSRRHQSEDSHRAMVEAHPYTGGRQNRWDRADANEEARAKRTPQEQLAELDRRLGVDVGAKRERARLAEAA